MSLVRQANAWTQAELAERAGVSQGYVSKIENGQLDIEAEQLDHLAAVLHVPSELLAVREHSLGVGVSCVHHRRRRSKLTATRARRIEGLTHLISLSVTRLMAELPLGRDVAFPRITVGRDSAAEAAQEVRALAGLGSEPIPDVIRLTEELGIPVIRRDLGTDAQDGVSLNLPERRPVIVVNTALPGDRQRLSVAHELGHLVLHGWQVPTGEDSVEQEAFEFAGELIAPRVAIGESLTGLTARDFRRLLELKVTWGMSIAGLIEHARRMQFIDDGVHRAMRIRLNELGWAKVEPGNVAEENPHLMAQVVDTHLDALTGAVDKVASIALMLPDPFRRHYVSHRMDPSADGEHVQ